ncbi:MAG: LEA type 2 family protein [Myxococcota bacterium]
MKKRLFAFILIPLLVSCATTRPEIATSQFSPEKVSIEYDRIDFQNPAITNIEYKFRFTVENKNDVDITLREVEYTFSLADIKIPEQKKGLNLKVGAQKDATFEIVIPVQFPEESERLEAFLAKRNADYELNGVVRGDGFELPIGARYQIILPEIPQVEVPGASISSSEKGEIGFTFDLLISNNNTFETKIDFFDYKVMIEDIPVGEGRVAELEKCPPNAQLSYTFPARIDLSKYAIQVKKMLSQKKFNYTVEGVLGINGKTFPVKRTGTINFSMR